MGGYEPGKQGEPRTSVRRLTAHQRKIKALELRTSGASFDEIAKALGYRGRSGSHKAVMSALEESLREPAEQVRTLEVKRLDAMLKALWPKVKEGSQGAIETALKVMSRRAKLLGLDAPVKVEMESEIDRRLEEMMKVFVALSDNSEDDTPAALPGGAREGEEASA